MCRSSLAQLECLRYSCCMRNGTVDSNFLRTVKLLELVICDKKPLNIMNGTLQSWWIAGLMIKAQKNE